MISSVYRMLVQSAGLSYHKMSLPLYDFQYFPAHKAASDVELGERFQSDNSVHQGSDYT